MANPIEPTPILRGEDAERLLHRLREEEKSPDPKRTTNIKKAIEFYKKIEKNSGR